VGVFVDWCWCRVLGELGLAEYGGGRSVVSLLELELELGLNVTGLLNFDLHDFLGAGSALTCVS
jgi:hypothetical protein